MLRDIRQFHARRARKGYFDGLTFHRVVPNFVVQGGDPRGDGDGGPGYTIRDERNQEPYLRGTLGMALAWRDTGGSQFFLTHSPQPHLDARYTVFGRVVAGVEIIDNLTQWDVIKRVRVWDGVGGNTGGDPLRTASWKGPSASCRPFSFRLFSPFETPPSHA